MDGQSVKSTRQCSPSGMLLLKRGQFLSNKKIELGIYSVPLLIPIVNKKEVLDGIYQSWSRVILESDAATITLP